MPHAHMGASSNPRSDHPGGTNCIKLRRSSTQQAEQGSRATSKHSTIPPRTSVVRGSGQPSGSTHCRPVAMLAGRRACSTGRRTSAKLPLPSLLQDGALPAPAASAAFAAAAATCAAATIAACSMLPPGLPAAAAAASPAAAPAAAASAAAPSAAFFCFPLPGLPRPAANSSWNCFFPLKAITAGAPQRPQVQPMAALARRVCASSRPKNPGLQAAKCAAPNCELSVPGLPLPTSVKPWGGEMGGRVLVGFCGPAGQIESSGGTGTQPADAMLERCSACWPQHSWTCSGIPCCSFCYQPCSPRPPPRACGHRPPPL